LHKTKYENSTTQQLTLDNYMEAKSTILKVWSKTEKEWEKISHWVNG
jgi:hypothetical protein